MVLQKYLFLSYPLYFQKYMDYHFVDIDDMQITEDIHMMFDHMLMRAISVMLRGGQ